MTENAATKEPWFPFKNGRPLVRETSSRVENIGRSASQWWSTRVLCLRIKRLDRDLDFREIIAGPLDRGSSMRLLINVWYVKDFDRCWISIVYKLIITRSKKRTNEPKENTMRRKWCTRRLKFCEAYIHESNFKDRINFLVRIDGNVLENLQYLGEDVIGNWFIVLSIAELILRDNYMSRNHDRIYFLTYRIFV